MKNFLIPFTAIIWYFVTYLTLFGSYVLLPIIFSAGWFWLIVYCFILFGVISLLFTLAGEGSAIILDFYKLNQVSCIVHSIFGLFAVIRFVYYLIENVPILSHNGVDMQLYSFMWHESPIRTIILIPIFIIGFEIVYAMVIVPVIIKTFIKKQYYGTQ